MSTKSLLMFVQSHIQVITNIDAICQLAGYLAVKLYASPKAQYTNVANNAEDNSDFQYRGFRQNIPFLIILLIAHPLLRRAYDAFWRANTYTQVGPSAGRGLTMGLTTSAAADARLNQRISFDIPFAVVFLVALHGFSIFKIVAILYINYSIAKKLPRPYVPAATWVFNVAILFANDLCNGYSYARIFSFFQSSSVAYEKEEPSRNLGHTLDSYGGLIPKWDVLFNFTILRLISFNLDYYWSLNSRAGSPLEVGCLSTCFEIS
jgi:hypothetical protein